MIDLGDVVVLQFQTSANESLVDATAVTLTVGLPDGTTVTVSNTRTSLGTYRADYPTVQAGRHDVRWVATGPGARTHSDVLNVAAAPSRALASLEEFRAHLNMTEPGDDEELRSFLEAATGVVERHLGQVVARRTITETHRLGCGDTWDGLRYRSRGLVVKQGPVLSLTAVTAAGTVLDPAGYVVDPVTGELRPVAGGSLGWSGDVTLIYVAGYRVVPAHMILASLIIAAHLWQTQRTPTLGPSPFGDAGTEGIPPMYGSVIPPRAHELLGGSPPVFS